MKTVVITGSARGFGFAMLKEFKENDFNVVICDINEEFLSKSQEELEKINTRGKVLAVKADITQEEDIERVINFTIENTKKIDIWINNAGVNQPNEKIWELDKKTIDRLIDIDLKGTILCSNKIIPIFLKQDSGALYNVEGHGSNDATITGLSL